MGIASKHAYRFNFLHSEEWKTVRSEALARERGTCQICGEFSISNDAHHIFYPPSFWQTQSEHLVILCRPCHQLMHDLPFYDVRSLEEALEQFDIVSITLREWLKQHRIKVAEKLADKKANSRPPSGCFACRKARPTVIKRELFPSKPNENSQWPFCDECWNAMEGKFRTFAGARKMAEIIREKRKQIVDVNVNSEYSPN